MNLIEVILGGPGAGKTAELLRLLEVELTKGVPAERIAFVTFTKVAAKEARARARELGLTHRQLRWFRTLHSLAFEVLGLRREDVMTKRHWTEFGESLGLTFGSTLNLSEGPLQPADLEGDRLRSLQQLARALAVPLEVVWRQWGAGLTRQRVVQFEAALSAYKSDLGLVDFPDMLSLFIERSGPIDVEVAFVDEAQDLTTEQWLTLEVAFAKTNRIYVAGDDDQAIYQWAGADVERFLGLEVPRRVLSVSYRLAKPVFELARAVASRITGRYPKAWVPAGHEGGVRRLVEPEQADLSEPGSWLLLARHRYQLGRLARACRVQGVPYSVAGISAICPTDVTAIRCYEALRAGKVLPWAKAELVISALEREYTPPALVEKEPERPLTAVELGLDCSRIWHDALVGISIDDREFYLACLRRGESLDGQPRIRVATIHGAKGQEADRVLVLSDLSRRTQLGYGLEPATEHRVFYVAATRARQHLSLVYPLSSRSYDWPENNLN